MDINIISFADIVAQNTVKNPHFAFNEREFVSGSGLIFSSYFAQLWSGDRFRDTL